MVRLKSASSILACVVAWGVSHASADDANLFVRPQHSCYRSFNKAFAQTKNFAEGAGIVTRCFTVGNTANSAGNPYSEYPAVWKGRDRYDWDLVDREFQDVVDVSPNARFIVLVDINTPPWLQRRLRYDSFSLISLAATDPRWMKETKAYLAEFLKHVEKKWGTRTLGYVLGAGNCTEWTEYEFYQPDSLTHVFTAPWQEEAWRTWCAKRGVNRGRGVPRGDELDCAAFRNSIYDPVTEGAKIDYWRFRNENVASALLEMATLAKEYAPKKEIGAFFGYYLLCNPHYVVSWDHLDYERVFDSPAIDFVITPANYTDRGCGGGTGTLLVQGSLGLRGKRLFHEIDFWPHNKRPAGQTFDAAYFKTIEDDIAGNTREAAFALVTHASLWWFDQWGGFYDTPQLFERIAQMEKLMRQYEGDTSASAADVLFVADPQSAYGINEKSKELTRFPWSVRDELAKTGYAVDYYSFNDLEKIDLSRYKVVVFPGTFLVTPERERVLREKVCAADRTVVWYYAPGISDGKTLDVKRIKALTGSEFGGSEVKTVQFPAWKSVYVPDYEITTLNARGFAQILRDARAHAWTDPGLVVHANTRLFSVHLKDGGDRVLRLPRRAGKVVELISGKTVARETDEFTYSFASPDTRIFEMLD